MWQVMGRAALVLLVAGATVQVASAQMPQSAEEALKDRVEYRLDTNTVVRKYDLKVKAVGSKITLTGEVATAAQKAEAGRIAKVDGVTEVENLIKVDPDTDRTLTERAKAGLNKAGDKIDDAWITTKVKWFMMGDDLLKGSDINVDTSSNVVTLKGTVKTEAGRARAIALAKDTDGVKRVVDELKIGG
jgi:hyperosmotically inducible protein